MKKFILITFACIFTVTGCATPPPKPLDPNLEFVNPVFTPVLADPSIIKAEDGWYYAYGTENFWGYDEGVKYGPITKSRNLVDWEYIGDVFEFTPFWHGGTVWAPDVQYFNDKYYLYYSMSDWGDSNPAIGLATATNPEGPWKDHGKFFDSNEIGVVNSIDSVIMQDEISKKRYIFWGSFHGIYAVEISEDGHTYKKETKVHIAGNAFEAPYIIKRGEYYYLLVSTGTCCEGVKSTYQVKVGRSKSLLGPYVDKLGNSLIHSSGSLVLGKSREYVGNGHNAVIKDDAGKDWIVYHGIDAKNGRMEDGATTRRPLFIDPLLWDSKGWPYVKDFIPSSGPVTKPVINNVEPKVQKKETK